MDGWWAKEWQSLLPVKGTAVLPGMFLYQMNHISSSLLFLLLLCHFPLWAILHLDSSLPYLIEWRKKSGQGRCLGYTETLAKWSAKGRQLTNQVVIHHRPLVIFGMVRSPRPSRVNKTSPTVSPRLGCNENSKATRANAPPFCILPTVAAVYVYNIIPVRYGSVHLRYGIIHGTNEEEQRHNRGKRSGRKDAIKKTTNIVTKSKLVQRRRRRRKRKRVCAAVVVVLHALVISLGGLGSTIFTWGAYGLRRNELLFFGTVGCQLDPLGSDSWKKSFQSHFETRKQKKITDTSHVYGLRLQFLSELGRKYGQTETKR